MWNSSAPQVEYAAATGSERFIIVSADHLISDGDRRRHMVTVVIFVRCV
jgi:hypothetical protein